MKWRLSALSALFALAGACESTSPPIEVVKNECLSDVNCVGKGVSCDLATQQCVRQQTLEPYRVLLQVQAESTLELRDAGVTLADQATFELGILEAGIQNKVLEMPGAERLLGSVSGALDGGQMSLLESEVTLVPRSGDALVRSTVVNTSKDNRRVNDAGVSTQVDTLLNPQFKYDVRVLPLLSASTLLPPLRERADDNPLDIQYGEVTSQTATLSSFLLTSWAGRRVRLEGEDGQVLSSTNVVNDDGQFALYAVPDVFDAPNKFKLAIGLDVLNSKELPRWQVKLALDGTLFDQGSTITVPDVPSMVHVLSNVEDEQSLGLPFANLDFVSDFPVPDGTAAVGEADWCRWRSVDVTRTLKCSAELSTTTDEGGDYEIDLIPGTYRLFVTPNDQPTDAVHPGTHQEAVTISRQPNDGPQHPQIVSVRPARRYLGTLLSPDGRSLPNVSVNARALALNRPETGELGEYNRSTSALSDDHGRFSIFTDVGVYDLSFEPPAGSNFAWVVCINRVIKADERRSTSVSLRPIRPSAPVYITGTVEHQGVLIPNARIEAFAVAKDLDGKSRTVLVSRATSDAQGAYRLAMPPRGGETECPPPLE